VIGARPHTARHSGGGEDGKFQFLEEGGREVGRTSADGLETVNDALNGRDTISKRDQKCPCFMSNENELDDRLMNRVGQSGEILGDLVEPNHHANGRQGNRE